MTNTRRGFLKGLLGIVPAVALVKALPSEAMPAAQIVNTTRPEPQPIIIRIHQEIRDVVIKDIKDGGAIRNSIARVVAGDG